MFTPRDTVIGKRSVKQPPADTGIKAAVITGRAIGTTIPAPSVQPFVPQPPIGSPAFVPAKGAAPLAVPGVALREPQAGATMRTESVGDLPRGKATVPVPRVDLPLLPARPVARGIALRDAIRPVPAATTLAGKVKRAAVSLDPIPPRHAKITAARLPARNPTDAGNTIIAARAAAKDVLVGRGRKVTLSIGQGGLDVANGVHTPLKGRFAPTMRVPRTTPATLREAGAEAFHRAAEANYAAEHSQPLPATAAPAPAASTAELAPSFEQTAAVHELAELKAEEAAVPAATRGAMDWVFLLVAAGVGWFVLKPGRAAA